MSHPPEGGWTDAKTGQWFFIDEHADGAKRPRNRASIGMPDARPHLKRLICQEHFAEPLHRPPLLILVRLAIVIAGERIQEP